MGATSSLRARVWRPHPPGPCPLLSGLLPPGGSPGPLPGFLYFHASPLRPFRIFVLLHAFNHFNSCGAFETQFLNSSHSRVRHRGRQVITRLGAGAWVCPGLAGSNGRCLPLPWERRGRCDSRGSGLSLGTRAILGHGSVCRPSFSCPQSRQASARSSEQTHKGPWPSPTDLGPCALQQCSGQALTTPWHQAGHCVGRSTLTGNAEETSPLGWTWSRGNRDGLPSEKVQAQQNPHGCGRDRTVQRRRDALRSEGRARRKEQHLSRSRGGSGRKGQ